MPLPEQDRFLFLERLETFQQFHFKSRCVQKLLEYLNGIRPCTVIFLWQFEPTFSHKCKPYVSLLVLFVQGHLLCRRALPLEAHFWMNKVLIILSSLVLRCMGMAHL